MPLSKAQLAKQVLARREYLGRDLMAFTQEIEGPSYLPGWVHRDICARLERFSEDVIAQKAPRLMLLMPPRHGKSTIASQMFPAFHLGKRPNHEIINVGYNLDLPTRFSRKVRAVLQSREYVKIFPDTKLDMTSKAVEAWLTTEEGGFTAAGRGGGITGKGAHVLIIDDPLKNMEEADNFDIREKLEDWYYSTAYTRLAPGGGILVIETMWHDDDLAGRLLAKMHDDPDAEQFEVIRYPAISTKYEYRHPETLEMTYTDTPIVLDENDPVLDENELLRAPGEALHAARYPIQFLEQVRTSGMPPRVWSALYQQDPVPEEGLCFTTDMFHYAPAQPARENKRYYIAWDFAISEKQRADFTVGVCLMQDENDNLYFVDMVRFQAGTERIVDEFVSMIKRWSGIPNSQLQLGVEDGQIWKAIKSTIKARMKEEQAYVAIEVLQAITEKKSRATALEGRMSHGRFWFVDGKPWNKEATRELQRFPAGRNDDIVDAMSWAVRLATGKKPRRAPIIRKIKSWKDELDKYVGNNISGGHMSA